MKFMIYFIMIKKSDLVGKACECNSITKTLLSNMLSNDSKLANFLFINITNEILIELFNNKEKYKFSWCDFKAWFVFFTLQIASHIYKKSSYMSYRIMMKFHLLQNLNPCCKKIFNSKKGETQTLIFFVIYSVEKITI